MTMTKARPGLEENKNQSEDNKLEHPNTAQASVLGEISWRISQESLNEAREKTNQDRRSAKTIAEEEECGKMN